MSMGRDSNRIDLVIVGDDINLANLERLALKAEKLVHRKIACTILTPAQAEEQLTGRGDLWRIF
jgi:hypothetical protein